MLFFITYTLQAYSLTLNMTRYVYTEGDKRITSTVKNPLDIKYGGQMWVEPYAFKTEGRKKYTSETLFVVTPSVSVFNAQEEKEFDIMMLEDQLPKDRESIFHLNLQMIPEVNDSDSGKNKIVLAPRIVVKLFYRPKALADNRQGQESKITLRCENDVLVISNPTPFFFSINKIVSGLSLDEKEISPLERLVVPQDETIVLNGCKQNDKYTIGFINDYGAEEPYTYDVQ